MKLKHLLEALHESMDTSSPEEIKGACELIILAQDLTGGEVDTLEACYENGPLFPGDLPSKTGRDSLRIKGLVSTVVVKGQDGYEACTQKGSWVYRLMNAHRVRVAPAKEDLPAEQTTIEKCSKALDDLV